jgi:hypothetical protein
VGVVHLAGVCFSIIECQGVHCGALWGVQDLTTDIGTFIIG